MSFHLSKGLQSTGQAGVVAMYQNAYAPICEAILQILEVDGRVARGIGRIRIFAELQMIRKRQIGDEIFPATGENHGAREGAAGGRMRSRSRRVRQEVNF